MKLSIVFTTFLLCSPIISVTANAAEECPAKEVIGWQMEKVLEVVSSRICSELDFSRGHDDVAIEVENHFLMHLNITRGTADYKLRVSEFWNRNSDYLICRNEVPGTRTPQHFMKRVIDMKLQKKVFHTFLLYDSEEFPIQFNAVEHYQGQPETFLDYLDNILADEEGYMKYDLRILRDIRETILEEYNAKTAVELIAECGG